MSARKDQHSGVIVVGLGRFGSHLADTLVQLEHPVLAIDQDAERVQRWANRIDRVVQADATDEEALSQLGAADLGRAVVAIGASLEASVLSVLALTELGIPQIWARATSPEHAKILASVGARHVIFPEAEAGERLAHLIVSRMLDFIEFGDDFVIAKVRTPESLTGRPLRELTPEHRRGVQVVGVKLAGKRFQAATEDTVLSSGTMLIVEGGSEEVQSFAALS
ncbi:potassium channel family protein [Salinispora tropica]|uniref:TrkA-N domain protein n=1 Tax=Salinispora tropica (strain ATCC BAA-916 / DSM 44818 / JCM 13857 / NBRC 105044 / CNB-440) TaxID=369723 RepID=A4X1V7_SALTO|nr:TrkA family potassium uptake protein [Salinispora tropica]ABP52857.1 TrkA-N domain protein [Salinispora tropica CNB-440]